jgi:hypothetical protein
MLSLDSNGAVPVTARRAKRENGGLGEDPPGSTMTIPQTPVSRFAQRAVVGRADLLTVPRIWMLSLDSNGAVPVTARRAKRENGGLGEDPPGSTM